MPPGERRIELAPPSQPREGCYYALCRVEVAGEVSGFVEVENNG